MRLDALLVQRGLAPSRERARELIESGSVLVDGITWDKPGARVQPDRDVRLASADHGWVSRGALKLLGALAPFAVSPEGLVCADLGASTGGFTEVLLKHGARRVYAIDVGHNQLAWRIRTDPRVVVMEGVNARHLESLPEPIQLVVGDLSFISLELILPAIAKILAPGGSAVLLIKPQFEAGRDAVGKGGVVRDPEARAAAIQKVLSAAEALGFTVRGGMDSTVPGAKSGNVEYLVHLAGPRA